ncbi:MAG: MFS transporter [Bacteroidales bacterium]|jgi:MFS family permease|nr:MFS transporter [Bacteroidales bacterium]
MKNISKYLTASILSMSLLTVMAGAAIAPALGVIKEHFAGTPNLLIQFIISIPALFIVFTNLAFPYFCKLFKTRTLALIGLLIYAICGTIPFFSNDIYIILIFRAILGVSVGMIMPLSTGLLSFYFPPEKQAELMGLSAAMNQMGGVVATLLAGMLANISWNFSFLVYLLGFIAVAMVAIFLPNERLGGKSDIQIPSFCARIKKFHPSVIGMFLCMSLFFVYPSNFAMIAGKQTALSLNAVTIIMVALDVIAFFVGLCFGRMMQIFRMQMKYFAPCGFIIGYLIFILSGELWALLAGSAIIGIANGAGIPYLNTIASIKGGKDAVTTVMPLISASLYLGQFLSPIYISALGNKLFSNALTAPYYIAVIVGGIYLIQVYTTRHFQALPPAEK